MGRSRAYLPSRRAIRHGAGCHGRVTQDLRGNQRQEAMTSDIELDARESLQSEARSHSIPSLRISKQNLSLRPESRTLRLYPSALPLRRTDLFPLQTNREKIQSLCRR